jgi:hypothetical protein
MSVGFGITFIGLLTRMYIEQTPQTMLKRSNRISSLYLEEKQNSVLTNPYFFCKFHQNRPRKVVVGHNGLIKHGP